MTAAEISACVAAAGGWEQIAIGAGAILTPVGALIGRLLLEIRALNKTIQKNSEAAQADSRDHLRLTMEMLRDLKR